MIAPKKLTHAQCLLQCRLYQDNIKRQNEKFFFKNCNFCFYVFSGRHDSSPGHYPDTPTTPPPPSHPYRQLQEGSVWCAWIPENYRRGRIPDLRSLGEAWREPEPCRTLRKYSEKGHQNFPKVMWAWSEVTQLMCYQPTSASLN